MGKRIVRPGILTLLMLMFVFGCSSATSIIKKVKPEQSYLKKKVMVLPATNDSGLPLEKAAQVTSEFTNILKESQHLIINFPPNNLVLSDEVMTTQFGVSKFKPDLFEKVKDRNMNALLAVYLPPIEVTQGKAGIWPFRHPTDIYKISMIVNVLDAMNGCLFLTNLDSETVVFDSSKVAGLDKKELTVQAVEKAMPKLVSRQADKVKDALAKESWTGRILDVENGQIKINAGKDAGVLPDQEFEVYTQGETVACKTGGSVGLMDKKMGTIKTVTVLDQYSLAVSLTGGPFVAGQTIMYLSN